MFLILKIVGIIASIISVIGTILAMYACCKLSGEISKEEEKYHAKNND